MPYRGPRCLRSPFTTTPFAEFASAEKKEEEKEKLNIYLSVQFMQEISNSISSE